MMNRKIALRFMVLVIIIIIPTISMAISAPMTQDAAKNIIKNTKTLENDNSYVGNISKPKDGVEELKYVIDITREAYRMSGYNYDETIQAIDNIISSGDMKKYDKKIVGETALNYTVWTVYLIARACIKYEINYDSYFDPMTKTSIDRIISYISKTK